MVYLFVPLFFNFITSIRPAEFHIASVCLWTVHGIIRDYSRGHRGHEYSESKSVEHLLCVCINLHNNPTWFYPHFTSEGFET